ncbi:MAG: 30S ribosomal protein S20 [bacterium]
MPITSSAKKALRQSLKRRKRNIKRKDSLKDILKEINDLISEKKIDEAKKILPNIYKILDKTAKVGIIKKGKVDRKKSRISKAIERAKSQR